MIEAFKISYILPIYIITLIFWKYWLINCIILCDFITHLTRVLQEQDFVSCAWKLLKIFAKERNNFILTETFVILKVHPYIRYIFTWSTLCEIYNHVDITTLLGIISGSSIYRRVLSINFILS